MPSPKHANANQYQARRERDIVPSASLHEDAVSDKIRQYSADSASEDAIPNAA